LISSNFSRSIHDCRSIGSVSPDTVEREHRVSPPELVFDLVFVFAEVRGLVPASAS
jgi:hypothetical protein